MPKPEATMQQMDPLSAQTSYDVAIFAGLLSWIYVVFAAVLSGVKSENALLMVGSVVLFSASIAVHIWASSAKRAPYTRQRYVVIVALALGATIVQIVSMGNQDSTLINDWGILALAFILAAASGFRPPSDQYLAGGAGVLGIVIALCCSGGAFGHPFGLAYFLIAAVSPLIVVVVGQAAYTGFGVRTIRKWQRQMAVLSSGETDDVDPEQLANKLDLDALLATRVSPFFERILKRGRVSRTDHAEATELATLVRSRLLSMSEQSWISRVDANVTDEEQLAAKFDSSAQAALTAVILGLKNAGVENIELSLSHTKGGAGRSRKPHSKIVVRLSGMLTSSAASVRTELAAYLRVIYVLFDSVRVTYQDGQVRLLCEYGESFSASR